MIQTKVLTINWVEPDLEVHGSLNWSPSHETRSFSFKRTVNPNVTLFAENQFDSEIGTWNAAGIGWYGGSKSYFESVAGQFAPITGDAKWMTLMRGALKTNSQLTLAFDLTASDTTPSSGSWSLIPEMEVPQQTPWLLRGQLWIDYDNVRDSMLWLYGDFSP